MKPRRSEPSTVEPVHLVFDRTPEIFASDGTGSFFAPLSAGGCECIDSAGFDEMRVLASVWYPAAGRTIDLDRTYLELRTRLAPEDERWVKLAEVEPVVPAYGGIEAFDGWIVLPVMGPTTVLGLFGSGFDPRARVQARASLYLVP